MPTLGKLDVTIKIQELPADPTTNKNGWKEFILDCGGRPVHVSVRPRMWMKLEEAQASFPLWTAAITGQMGAPIGKGFLLAEPAIQVFERKARVVEPPPEAPPT